VPPVPLTAAVAQRRQHCIECLELAVQPAVLPAMRVPSAGLEHRDARPVGARQEPRREPAEVGRVLPGSLVGHAANLQRRRPERMEQRIGAVHPGDAGEHVVRHLR
jgi:hypothetical protein